MVILFFPTKFTLAVCNAESMYDVLNLVHYPVKICLLILGILVVRVMF